MCIQLLVDVNVLGEGLDATHLTGLLAVDADHRTALGDFLLEDVEHTPKGIGIVLGADGGEQVSDAFLVCVHRGISREVLADAQGIEGELGFLLVREGDSPHIVESAYLTIHRTDGLHQHLVKCLHGILGVADFDVHEGVGADHKAVGADKAEKTDTEGEGIKAIVGVGEDDARVALHIFLLEHGEGMAVAVIADIADDVAFLVNLLLDTGEGVVTALLVHIVGLTDSDLRVLEGDDVEGTDAGLLTHLLLLGFNGKPATACEVINDLLRADIAVAVGKVGIGRGGAEHLGGDGLDVGLGEELGGDVVVVVGNHSVHNALGFDVKLSCLEPAFAYLLCEIRAKVIKLTRISQKSCRITPLWML